MKALLALLAIAGLATSNPARAVDPQPQTNAPANAAPNGAQSTMPEAGQKVLFLGDENTIFGLGPNGYATLIAKALEQDGKRINVIPRGGWGNRSTELLARLNNDVLSQKPDWMILSCGVNDVVRGANGVPIDQFQQNVTSIVDQATAAGIRVVILTVTMLGEDPSNANNQKLVAYNDFLRSLAAQKHLLLADLNADMQAALAKEKAETPDLKGNVLTADGVHMNGPGHEMMAAGVLKAFGFTDAQLAQAKELWMDLPGGAPLDIKDTPTVRQYLHLRMMAASQGRTVEEMLAGDLDKVVQGYLSTPIPTPTPTPTKTPPPITPSPAPAAKTPVKP